MKESEKKYIYPGYVYIYKSFNISGFKPICSIHIKCLDFNDFEVINMSKKHKNINNKQKHLKSFVTNFDKIP